MTPTRLSSLVALFLGAGVVGLLLVRLVYGDLPPLPGYAPVPIVLLAVFELGLARAVRARLRGPVRGRSLHPLQVARAAVLAKASSTGAALLGGAYAGLLVQVLRLRAEQAHTDALVSAGSSAACLLLVLAALLLERSCRTPDPQP
ncbi:MAG: putative integral rane protein [Frankiales bacterium]|nr:putative integral rane protein [Frankiales bacterium]